MPSLFIVKVAYLTGQMICMTSQPHTVPVQAFLDDVGATLLAAEATYLPQNRVFSGQVVYEGDYLYGDHTFHMVWGCYPQVILPKKGTVQ